MTDQRPTTSRLEPGEHTIDRVTPREVDGRVWLDWTIRLHDDTVVHPRSKGRDADQARRRARRKAAQLLGTAPLHALAEQIAALSPARRRELDKMVKRLIGDTQS